MSINLTNPIFHDEDAARAHLEKQRWPNGVVCPHCGSDAVTKLQGEKHRTGLFECRVRHCREQFTVTVGTVMESSHLPLTKWTLAIQLMASSKKGVSAKQIERTLGVSYRTAWFLMHRIREAMKIEDGAAPIGGEGKTVESDETFVGGKKKNVHRGKPEPKKHAVHALVERGGRVRARHVPDVSAKTLRKAIRKHVAKGSTMNTDEALAYYHMKKEFDAHGAVNHSAGEYVSRDGKTHIQSAEAFFAILKRGIMGSFHLISEAHLQRYLDEFAFRWNHRQSLDIDDTMRAAAIVKAAEGKRLTYRRIGGQEEGAP